MVIGDPGVDFGCANKSSTGNGIGLMQARLNCSWRRRGEVSDLFAASGELSQVFLGLKSPDFDGILGTGDENPSRSEVARTPFEFHGASISVADVKEQFEAEIAAWSEIVDDNIIFTSISVEPFVSSHFNVRLRCQIESSARLSRAGRSVIPKDLCLEVSRLNESALKS